jgi:hypothetical protein
MPGLGSLAAGSKPFTWLLRNRLGVSLVQMQLRSSTGDALTQRGTKEYVFS